MHDAHAGELRFWAKGREIAALHQNNFEESSRACKSHKNQSRDIESD